ncbi:hypothetical protein GF415_04130 [Candidatus Micrarchaeota archaeon]|nr:hypothetical protein [Candidatus Micrarchaeota archaeon]
MLEQLKKAAVHINEMESTRAGSAKKAREEARIPEDSLEPEYTCQLRKPKIEGRVSAVDGGILAYEMHGADLLIAKAVSSTFDYQENKIISNSYFPRAFPEPEYAVETGLDEREMNWHKSLFRLKLETENALETAKSKNPGLLLLDGSLCPLMSDRPAEESKLFPDYMALLNKYKELYSFCSENNVLLAGIIKDCRSRRFLEMFPETGERGSDSVFLNHLLKEGERTFSFRYSSSPQKHHVLRELGAWGEKLCATYLKPVQGDRPLRVEFLKNQGKARELAEMVFSLSSINRSYAYPAVLIDADLRAMMDPNELERAKKSLSLFTGPSLLDLRRNSRPFR